MFRIIPFLCLILACGSQSTHSPTQQSTKPNIILIMADDLGYGDIGCFGNTRIFTPNLDRMAAEGLRLTDYHSNGPICSPTRAALMTGRYQQRAGIDAVISAKNHRHTGMDLSERTIAEQFSDAGYATAIFGKWHLGYPAAFNPFHQGFQLFRGYVSGNVDFHSHIDQAGYEDWWRDTVLVPEEGYVTDLITKHSLRFIREHKDRPFFLYLAHEAPHYPYQGRKDTADRWIGGTFPTHGSRKDVAKAYKEMVEVMDEGIGKVMDAVNELGLAENTLIIFISDNGATKAGNNGVLKGGKGSLWEGGHRVPGIAWWPKNIQAGTESGVPILSMDWFPTFSSLAGIPSPTDVKLDGVDVSEVLLSNHSLSPRPLFWHFKTMRGMREGKWKLIWDTKNETVKLFDLEKDLSEDEDLSEQEVDRVGEMKEAIRQWEADVKAGVEMRS